MQRPVNSRTVAAAVRFARRAAVLLRRPKALPPKPYPLVLGPVIGVLLSIGTAAHANDAELVSRGAAIAASHCSQCHAVGTTGKSPHTITPPLRALGERFPIDMLREAQRTAVLEGHDEMPGFEFGVDGVVALLAYIDSLSPTGPQYLPRSK